MNVIWNSEDPLPEQRWAQGSLVPWLWVIAQKRVYSSWLSSESHLPPNLKYLLPSSQIRVTTIWTWCWSIFSPCMNSFCLAGVLTKGVLRLFFSFLYGKCDGAFDIMNWAMVKYEIMLFNLSWTFLLAESHCYLEYVTLPIAQEVDFLWAPIVLKETMSPLLQRAQ